MLGTYAIFLARSSGVGLAPAPPVKPLLGGGGKRIPLAARAAPYVVTPRLNGGHLPAATKPPISSPRCRGPAGLGGGATIVRIGRPPLRIVAKQAGHPIVQTVVIGTASQRVGPLTESAVGTALETGTASQILGGLHQSAAGATVINSTAAQLVGGLSQAGTGTSTETGSAVQLVGGVRQNASGIVISAGSAAQRLGEVLQAASGSISVHATATQRVGGILETAAGFSIFTATAAQHLGALRQTSAGLAFENAEAAQSLGAIREIAHGTTTYPETCVVTVSDTLKCVISTSDSTGGSSVMCSDELVTTVGEDSDENAVVSTYDSPVCVITVSDGVAA